MAEEQNAGATENNAQSASNAAPSDSAESTIRQLLEEKKALEEKNRKLAELLNICAAGTEDGAGAKKDDTAQGSENVADLGKISEEIALLKKSVTDTGKKIEKSLSAQNAEQWNALMAEMKSRFASVEQRISAIDGIRPMQKKLDEIEAEVRDKRRRGGNPFGKIGALGGDGTAQESDDEDNDIVKKLEEFEQKIDRLGNRIGARHETETHGSGIIQRLEGIIPKKMKAEAEKIASKFSHYSGPAAQRDISGNATIAVAAGAKTKAECGLPAPISGVTFRPVEEKVSEEVLESLILDTMDDAGVKMRVKVHEPSDFSDASKIQNDIIAGDIILVDIKTLRQNDMELLRKIVDQLKKTCAAVNGKMTGVGDSYLVVMPKNVQLHKE